MAVSSAYAANTDAASPGATLAEACGQDIQTLCPGMQPGDGRIKACLKEKHAKLSDGCKSAIKAQRSARKAAGK
jgi:hypothetical protein